MGVPWLTPSEVEWVCAVFDADVRVGRLATLQGGVVERDQVLALGLSEKGVEVRLRHDRLTTLHQRVYAVGHRALTRRGRAIAALLAVPESTLSHRTAAAVRDVRDDDLQRSEVTGTGRRETITVHRAKLAPDEVELVHGLPVTKLPRTLLDLAEVLPFAELCRSLREARVKHGLSDEELHAQIARSPGRRGIRALRSAMGSPQGEPTKSWAERRLLAAIRDTDLPQPRPNEVVAGKERDLAWPQLGFVVEIDDYRTHGDAATFESDRARDNHLALADVEVRRFTKLQIRDDLTRVLTTIAFRLGHRAGTLPVAPAGRA